MASYYRTGKTFAVAYRLKGQPREYLYGIKSEKLARQAKHSKDLQEQLARAGLYKAAPHAAKIDAAEAKPIEEHLITFERSIVNEGSGSQHAQQTTAHVRRLLKMARVNRISQLEAEPIQDAAKKLMDEGLAPRTANAALKASRQFSTWLMTSKRTSVDLLHRKLVTFNEAKDQRRLRRELSAEEFEHLLFAAESGRRRCGLTGFDRAMLYQVAVGTGFRMRACLSLSKRSFNVGETNLHPSILLAAKFNKNGKERSQAIRRDLAAMLRDWLKVKPDEGPAWKSRKYSHLELMMKRDLEAARNAWIKAAANKKETERREESSFLRYQDHAGRFSDFHSLRHTGISRVVRYAGLKVGQAWADHSTPALTARYAHLDLTDEAKALEALPEAQTPQARQLARSRESSGKVGVKREGRKIG